ncbi:protein phosphatase 2C domain-containing protein [Bifidobacterium sp. ESL0745]|uniref:protein phosphatase 2C domain-containing protein n=1 Tax=Bifidobacterium sp. ESL0745 TaxID=2983226 RepID=UPI0023F80BB8|nr:protein phosphatase 2C domain-containing protein [Bifidobacterium sp. ESL0745]MDF7665525.1 protein phosphatase 2C domain-containing protein [Bifidobacterium sp. ESL0745]
MTIGNHKRHKENHDTAVAPSEVKDPMAKEPIDSGDTQQTKHAANGDAFENRVEEPSKEMLDTTSTGDAGLAQLVSSVKGQSAEFPATPTINSATSSKASLMPPPPSSPPKEINKEAHTPRTVEKVDKPSDNGMSKPDIDHEASATVSSHDIPATSSNQYPQVESGFRKGAAFLGTKDQKNDNSYVRWIPHEAYEENQQRDMMGSVVDVVNINGLIVGAAATRGFNHFGSRERQVAKVREDAIAFSTACNHRYIVASIADGVSAADSSSYGAQEAVKFALSDVQSQLDSSTEMSNINWEEVFEYVCNGLGGYYLSKQNDFPSRDLMAFRIGTTCEVLVVDTQRGKHGEVPFIRATLAGDGAGYILHRPKSHPEVELIGEIWKLKDADFNTVGALPEEPPEGFPHIVKPSPAKTGECIMLTSDGIDEDMKEGNTKEARYLYHQLISHSADNPITQPELLQTIQYVTDCSGDDRSIVAIWC